MPLEPSDVLPAMVLLLSYAQQVLELEKIARLEHYELPPCYEPPRLAELARTASCLVCERRPARACQLCESVSYCSDEHAQVDAPWHQRVCEALRDIAQVGAAAGAPPDASRASTLSHLIRRLELDTSGANGPLRLHVMAAAAAEVTCAAVYDELVASWPQLQLEISLIGPELEPPAAGKSTAQHVRLSFRRAEYRRALWQELGTPALIVGFDAGLLLYPSWRPTLLELIGGGVPFAITSYREWEAQAEAQLLTRWGASCVVAPAANPFASRLARRSSTLANDVSYDNAYLSVWR